MTRLKPLVVLGLVYVACVSSSPATLQEVGGTGAGTVPTLSPSESAAPVPACRVLIVADLHGGGVRALQAAAAHGPYAAIISVGDAIDVDGAFEAAQISARWSDFDRLIGGLFPSVPVYMALGNHEIGTWLRAHDPVRVAALAAFRQRTGALYYAIEIFGVTWLFLDAESTSPPAKRIDPEQLAWLAGVLERTTQPTVVVTHTALAGIDGYPQAPATLYFENGAPLHVTKENRHSFFQVANASEVLARMTPTVRLILSAHLHSYNMLVTPERTFVNLPSAYPSLAVSSQRPGTVDFAAAYPNPESSGYTLSSARAVTGFSVLEVRQGGAILRVLSESGAMIDSSVLTGLSSQSCPP